MTDDEAIDLTLLENGIDFLREAVRRLEGEPDDGDLKYAVLHLNSGLQLILKERLRQADWRQLFLRPREADPILFARGDFSALGPDDLVKRLRAEGVAIDRTVKSNLTALRLRRRLFEHFQITESKQSVMASAAWALGFGLEFISSELEPSGLDAGASADLEAIREALPELRSFVDHRHREIEPQLQTARDRGTAVVACLGCLQEAALIDDGIRCMFCGRRVAFDGVEEAAGEYPDRVLGLSHYVIVKDGGEWPLYFCPECELETLIDRGGEGAEESRFVCFACGQNWSTREFDQCARCGSYFASSEGETVCGACFAAAVGRE